MNVFEIKLKKERTKPYRLLAQLILLVNLLFFLMMAIYEQSQSAIWLAAAVGGITLAWVAFAKWKKPEWSAYWMQIMLGLIVIAHAMGGMWWVSITLLALALLYKIAMRPLVVIITKEHIEYPSVPKRRIAWEELNNVILKDGLLTVDFRNNRLAQLPVSDEWYTDAANDEKDLNLFCSLQLSAQVVAVNH